MNGTRVFLLQHDNKTILISTNFQAIYSTLKKYQRKLGIKSIYAYSTLKAQINIQERLIFNTTNGPLFFIERKPVTSKPVNYNQLFPVPF